MGDVTLLQSKWSNLGAGISDSNPSLLTLYDHLIAGHEDLLPVAGLRVLQDGRARLTCSRAGHGQSLQALHPVCAVIGQLDGPSLSDGDWTKETARIKISAFDV